MDPLLLSLGSLQVLTSSPPFLPLIECDVWCVDNFPPYYCFVPHAPGEFGPLSQTIPGHTTYTSPYLCQTIPYLCQTFPYLCQTMPYHGTLCQYQSIECHTMSHHIMPKYTRPYHTIYCYTSPNHTISWCTRTHHTQRTTSHQTQS